MKKITILGTVGIPAAYGGFETLAENLAQYCHNNSLPCDLVVYCSTFNYPIRQQSYLGAELHYIPLKANGISSILYDIASLISATYRNTDVILLLGVSGALVLPLVRLLTRSHIVTNIDGIEWKRKKWKWAARLFLRLSEFIAVRYSHDVIADNAGIAEHVNRRYGRECHIIPYGGDHALKTAEKPFKDGDLPDKYALALCRIEPENNVNLILEAFTKTNAMSLVFIGNWNNSDYGRQLKNRYSSDPNIRLLEPIYDVGVLHSIRRKAAVYIHGHSAGGTNPSLVEMMHFGLPIFAYDCTFNRYTTDEKALLFADKESLITLLENLSIENAIYVGSEMKRIANERYRWKIIGSLYFKLLLNKKNTD